MMLKLRSIPMTSTMALMAGFAFACSAQSPGDPTGTTAASTEESALVTVDGRDDAFVDTAVVQPGQVHAMALRPDVTNEAAKQPSAPAGAHLTYYGGPVISNVKIVQVEYGTGTYLANIAGTATPTMSSFYGQVTNSKYFDWLTEYNTPSQHIGRGSFSKNVKIAPSSKHNGSTISDASIQAEISAQITKGVLPAPDANTLYMVSFPKGKHITQGGSGSCVAGGFCAYHGTFKRNGADVYYGVLPDMSPGSGCDRGCGGGTWYANQTSVASHELVESVTDAAVGLATVYGPPLAWYDANNGEIGDICNAQQGTIAGSDGHTYTVQKEWSNTDNACIVSH